MICFELHELAGGDSRKLTFLNLAEDYNNTDDPAERVMISRAVYLLLPGTIGRKLVVWEALRDAVAMWQQWDSEADRYGNIDPCAGPTQAEAMTAVEESLEMIVRPA